MSNIDLPTVQKWMVVGSALRRLILGRGKAAQMYSYNGVVLPKLPEWDKTKYPYAVIGYSSVLETYVLSCRSAIQKVSSSGVIHLFYGSDELNYELISEKWSIDTSGRISVKVNWSNEDIYYSDYANAEDGTSLAGVLYLAKSDPVPVYE